MRLLPLLSVGHGPREKFNDSGLGYVIWAAKSSWRRCGGLISTRFLVLGGMTGLQRFAILGKSQNSPCDLLEG